MRKNWENLPKFAKNWQKMTKNWQKMAILGCFPYYSLRNYWQVPEVCGTLPEVRTQPVGRYRSRHLT